MANVSNMDFATRLKAELLRDKKKLGLMLVLVAVCATLVVRAVWKVKLSSPETAEAAPAAFSTEATPAASAGLATSDDSLSAQRRADQEKRQEYLAKMDRQVRRDVFRPSLESFPTSGSLSEVDVVSMAAASATSEGPGMLGEIAQLVADQQNAQRDQTERINAIRVEARGLSLQTTIMGSNPTALINGQVLHAGDWINKFQIKSISPTACVVIREGLELEVPMTKEKH